MKEWFCIYLARDRKSGPFSLFLCRLYTRDILASGDAFRSTGGCNSNRTSDRTEFWNFTFKSFLLSFEENMSFIKNCLNSFLRKFAFWYYYEKFENFPGKFLAKLEPVFPTQKRKLTKVTTGSRATSRQTLHSKNAILSSFVSPLNIFLLIFETLLVFLIKGTLFEY